MRPAGLSGRLRSRCSSMVTIPEPGPRRSITSPKSPASARGQHSAFTPSANGVPTSSSPTAHQLHIVNRGQMTGARKLARVRRSGGNERPCSHGCGVAYFRSVTVGQAPTAQLQQAGIHAGQVLDVAQLEVRLANVRWFCLGPRPVLLSIAAKEYCARALLRCALCGLPPVCR